MLQIVQMRKMCEISRLHPGVTWICDCVLDSSCCGDVWRQLLLFHLPHHQFLMSASNQGPCWEFWDLRTRSDIWHSTWSSEFLPVWSPWINTIIPPPVVFHNTWQGVIKERELRKGIKERDKNKLYPYFTLRQQQQDGTSSVILKNKEELTAVITHYKRKYI